MCPQRPSGPLLEIHVADSPRWRRQLQEVWKLMCKTQSLQHGCWASWHAPLAERFSIISCTIARTFSRKIVALLSLHAWNAVVICRHYSHVKFLVREVLFLAWKSVACRRRETWSADLRCRSSCSSSGASSSATWPSQRCQGCPGWLFEWHIKHEHYVEPHFVYFVLSHVRVHSSGFRGNDCRSMSTTQVQPPGSNIVLSISEIFRSFLSLCFVIMQRAQDSGA